MANVNVMEFGAAGDGVCNDAGAMQRAIDACAQSGGGRVVVPGGRVLACGPVCLRSNIELHVEHGARIVAIPDRSLYTCETLPELGGDGRLWLHAIGARNIAITGSGIIDGSGVKFMAEETPTIFRTAAGRPFLLHLEDCRDVLLRDVTLHDAPFWTLHLMGCQDVQVSGIRIANHLKIPNTDGIDVNCCRNVRIVGCTVVGGDDAICIKSEAGAAHYGDCQDVFVTGCTLQSTSCAIKIGSGTVGRIRRIVFTGCSVFGSHRGLGIQLRDGGVVEDVVFADMTVETRYQADAWWGDATSIYVTALRRLPETTPGTIRNVRFSNILCRGENGVLVMGELPEQITNIAFENVQVQIEPAPARSMGRYDLRPCAMRPGVRESPTDGFHIDGAVDVQIRHCQVRWPEPALPFHRQALFATRCRGLLAEDELGKPAAMGIE